MPGELFITVDAAPASDNWGFVARVLVGEHEAYRTIRAYPTASDAVTAVQQLFAGALGVLLAGQEWSSAQEAFGHPPRRTELDFGLGAKVRRDQS